MDEAWTNRLNNEEYKNWLKVSQALLQTKEALHDFSRKVIEIIHADIQKRTGSGICDGTCNTSKGKPPSCPSCANWVKEIKSYNKGLLNWKNTDPKIWHDVPWEIAKCFMNPQGSKTTATANTGPEKTDLSGILNVLVNCKEFADVYLKEKKHPQTVREIRNKVMHSATMGFTEDVMKDYVNRMIAFLEDEKHLKNLKICNEKVRLLKLLRDGEFEILPEVEIDCLEGILKSDKLHVESGGEVDVAFRSSFNYLSRSVEHLISDLEKRMDNKIDRVEDRFETRMTSYDFNYGELKGSVEWLVNRVSELEKKCGVIPGIASAASSRAAKQNDKLQFKNSLQCYAQKKKLGIPEYMHKETDDHKFISTVSVGDKQFESKEPKGNKKEADQSAAEVALREFTSEVSSKNKEEDATSPPSNGDPAGSAKMQKDKSVNYKNQLQELAQQQTLVLPIYEREKTEDGLFLSKVFFDGRWYTPATGHARKIDADQKAAEFVLAYLERNKETSPKSSASLSTRPAAESSDGETEQSERSMTGESKEKDTSSMEACSVLSSLNNKPPQTDLTSNALISTGTIDATDSPDDKKTFKSKLNEYAQRQSPGVPPKYEDIECSAGYRSKVTIMDRTFEGEIPQSGKKEAREMAAKEAWNTIHSPVLSPTSSPSSVNIKVDVRLSSCNDGSSSGEDSTIQCSSPEKKDSKSNGLHDASFEISTPKCLPPILDQDFDPLALLGKRSSISVGVSTASASSELGTVDEDVQNHSSETVPTCQSDGRKMFRSKLNEYLQTVGSANATYVEINCDSGYRYKVTVLDKTYEGDSPEKSKKEAKEEAAKQACLLLELEQDSSDNGSPESPGTSTDACGKCPGNEVEANVVQGETLAEDDEVRNSKETIARDALKTDGSKDKGVDIAEQMADTAAPSNSKAFLVDYANQNKIKPMYVTKPIGGTKEYVSKVFLGKRCYKGENASRKKEAEQNAAKVAWEELVGPGSPESIAGNCKEFLVTYHEDMEVNSDFPKYEEITSTNGAGVVVIATVVRRWKISLVGARTKKKDFEERLAEEAIKVLEEEKKVVPTVVSGNCRARLNQFRQQHRNAPAPSYDVLDSEPANFSGDLTFYTVEKYESLSPKSSKDEAIASAAKSACNDLDLI